jgi:hypothetical protein
MLGFLGNMISAPCCVTMGLLRFLSNATVPVAQQWVCCVSLVTQQLKRRRYYGYGVVIYERESSNELVSCIGEPVEVVRVFEKLLTVINGCVLNFECNKVPS